MIILLFGDEVYHPTKSLFLGMVDYWVYHIIIYIYIPMDPNTV